MPKAGNGKSPKARFLTEHASMYGMASRSWSDVPLLQKSFPFDVNSVFTTAPKLIPKSLVNEPRKQQRWHGQTVSESIGIKSMTSRNILPSGQRTRLTLTMRNFDSLT